jgi:diaminopimelate decarboxylase
MNCVKLVAKENHYIPGTKLLEMCQQFKTPFYLYDLNQVISQYRSLYSYIKWPKLRIYYALKANYNIDILEVLKSYDGYLDTVSPAEVLLGLKLGYKKEHILFTANNMTDMEMCLIKQHNVLFNIDSISRLEKYAEKYPDSEVCLRFNADVVAGENEKVQTGGDDTKFGILLENVP